MFVESAIILESGLHNMVDEIWNVEAPAEVRISRAMSRDNASREQILARISCQQDIPSEVVDADGCSVTVRSVVNDGRMPVLPQILRLIELIGRCL